MTQYSILEIEQLFQLMGEYQISSFEAGDLKIGKPRHQDKSPKDRLEAKQNQFIQAVIK